MSQPDPAATPLPATEPEGEPEDEDERANGRIGYGAYGRFTPLALAGLLVVALLAIGIYREGTGKQQTKPNALIGDLAPNVTLTLLDGRQLRLADLAGSVVLVNFWASWCAPCRQEAPAFEALSKATGPHGTKIAVVGVGLKNDEDDAARAFVKDLGLTYPIGRDLGGSNPTRGPIELAFGVDPTRYPETFVLRPNGSVAAVLYGQTDLKHLQAAVAKAVA